MHAMPLQTCDGKTEGIRLGPRLVVLFTLAKDPGPDPQVDFTQGENMRINRSSTEFAMVALIVLGGPPVCLENDKKRQSLPLLCSPLRIKRKGAWHRKRDGIARGRGGDVWNAAGWGVRAKLDCVVRAIANHHPKIDCV